MADSDRIGWEIQGRFYPHVGSDGLLHGDFALIREVTGITLDQFDRGDDPLATETGWIAVAMWHGNTELRRDQVVQIVERLPADGAKRVGWDVPVEADAGPPADAGGPLTSGGSSTTSAAQPEGRESSESGSSAEQTPAASSPVSSGSPRSAGTPTSPSPTSGRSTVAAV